MLYGPCTAVGKEAVGTVNGVLHFVGYRLMDGNGASVALNRSRFLLLAVYSLHLLTISLSGFVLSHHHLFLMSLHVLVPLSHLSLTKLLFTQFAITTLHHFSVAAEIRWRVLR